MDRGAGWPFCLESAQFREELAGRLKLYAKQLGFIHSAPKGSDGKAHNPRSETQPHLVLPDVSDGEYILDAFVGFGFAPGGEPVRWVELAAYASLMGGLDEWEARTLRLMSCEYLAGKQLGENPFAIPPYEVDEW